MGLLDQFAILNEMSPEERESLFEFLEESSYEDGRAIFRDHDEAAELVLVTAGDVRLEAGGHAVGELTAGAALGHASLVTIGLPLGKSRRVHIGQIAATVSFDGESIAFSDYLDTYRQEGEYIPFFLQRGAGRFKTAPEDGQPIELQNGDRILIERSVYVIRAE